MHDDMQIDSSPSATPAAPPVIAVTAPPPDQALSAMFVDDFAPALHRFIVTHLTAALGSDYAPVFLADLPPSASHHPPTLLAFVDQHWVAVFCDSTLKKVKPDLVTLRKVLRKLPRLPEYSSPFSILTPSLATAHQLAYLAERILQSVSPTVASRAAVVRAQLSANSTLMSTSHTASLPSSPLSTSPPPPPSLLPSTRTQTRRPRSQMPTFPAPPPSSQQTQVIPLPPLPTAPHATPYPTSPCFVLDGSNIAWSHGAERRFSIAGPYLALYHFLARGHPAVIFLPEPRVSNPEPNPSDRFAFDAVSALRGTNMLVVTPAHEYDDAYICSYAREHAAVVVSNDHFNDLIHQKAAEGKHVANDWQEWVDACRIGFTFCKDEFLPTSYFNWPRAAEVSHRVRMQL